MPSDSRVLTVLSAIEVETARLRLRRWRESDRAPFAAMNVDAEVMEFFASIGSREASDASIDAWQSQARRQHEHPPAAIASPVDLRHRDIRCQTRTLPPREPPGALGNPRGRRHRRREPRGPGGSPSLLGTEHHAATGGSVQSLHVSYGRVSGLQGWTLR